MGPHPYFLEGGFHSPPRDEPTEDCIDCRVKVSAEKRRWIVLICARSAPMIAPKSSIGRFGRSDGPLPVLRDRAPLAASAEEIHQSVDHIAQSYRTLVAAWFGRREQGP